MNTPRKATSIDLYRIEVQAILDALIFTEENAIVSDAHTRAKNKVKRILKRASSEGSK